MLVNLNKRKFVLWLMVILFSFLSFASLSKISRAEDNINQVRVSSFRGARNLFPLSNSNGGPPLPLNYTDVLYGALKNQTNFGSNGTVKCTVEFKPELLVDYLSEGTLVDENNNLNAEVFFAGVSIQQLSNEEALELWRFINHGGVVYLSGWGADNPPGNPLGPQFNPLFEKLNIDDRFSNDQLYTGGGVQSSDPPDSSPITGGLFGTVGPLKHASFRDFSDSSLI